MKHKVNIDDFDMQVALKMVMVFSKAIDGVAKALAAIAHAIERKSLILK